MTKVPLESCSGISMLKKRGNTSVKKYVKRKKLNSHYYKKMFQIGRQKVKSDIKACVTRELADAQFEVSTEMHNRVLPYVNKLRAYWNRGQNAVIFDGQDRMVKVVSFVLSLLDSMKKPVLIIASSSALILWEVEFSKWSKSVKVVTYKGNKDIRAAIRDTQFQVLLSSLDTIVEDMEMLDDIKWKLLVIDECQRPIFSTHFKKLQMFVADMKLLTVSSELVDTCQSYRNILSLLAGKNEKINTDAEMEIQDNINKLKEKLSPFIAFECKFNTPEFEEYWVPVHLSSTQMEQYCSILVSNLETLTSSPRNSSLHDILTQIQKSCDHPYLVDPTLRNSSKKDSLIDPLDAEINVSGKMQLLNKLLLEIKQCGLRAVVLFQSAVNSEKISTGHFLDDLVHQRFGENSYVYIPGKILSNSAYLEKKQSLKMFNSVESEHFICLFDYRACHSSIRLSRVDAVILFNSDRNPSNDIKALKRITIDSPCERLKVFRLYSAFTIEEKALIVSKQGTSLDNYISSSASHQLLAWGASYLFSKLQTCTDSIPVSFIDDVVHELSSLLNNTRVETGPTTRSRVSNATMQNGGYNGSILLFGETEAHTKESYSVEEYLIDNTPCDFWSNLVKESQHRPNNSCGRLPRRGQKPPRSGFECGNLNDATVSSSVREKLKGKRKRKVNEKVKRTGSSIGAQLPKLPSTSISDSIGLNPTSQSQQSQNDDQPPPHASTSAPLETESLPSNMTDAQLPILHSISISDSIGLTPTSQSQQSQDADYPPPHASTSTTESLPSNLTNEKLPILPSTSISNSIALNPRTCQGQQSQTDQLPLEAEIERIQKERERISKSHQDKKSMLFSECGNKFSEVKKKYDALIHESDLSLKNEIKILEDYQKLANANKSLADQIIKLHQEKKSVFLSEYEKEMSEVQKKYEALIHDSETRSTNEIKILGDYEKLVNANKLLADILAQNWQDTLILNQPEHNLQRKRKETSSVMIHNIPASVLVRPKNPCWRGLSGGSGLQAPAPHLRSNSSTFASFHHRPATHEPFLDPFLNPSTTQTQPCIQAENPCLTRGQAQTPGHGLAWSRLRAPALPLRSNPSAFPSYHNRPATGEPFVMSLPSLSNTQTLPCIRSESSNRLYQVYGDLPILSPMEFDRIYDEGGPSLTIFGSNQGTF